MGGTSQTIFREETTILISQNIRSAQVLVEDTPDTSKYFVSLINSVLDFNGHYINFRLELY